MKTEIKTLQQQFFKIKEQGWIKSIRNGSTGIGITFEHLLGLNENGLEIPDYGEFEIKTKRNYSKSYTTLFNCTPEGPYYREIERLKDKYGYPDNDMKQYKVLNVSIFADNKVKVGTNYYFKLNVDRSKRKIFLTVIDIYGNLIENNVYWSFDTLKEKLYRKVKNIAFVDAIKKYIGKDEYFKFIRLTLYTLKNFDIFIKLIEQGIIRITFKISVFKSGNRIGQIHDHGTGFDIRKNDLLKLYNIYKD